MTLLPTITPLAFFAHLIFSYLSVGRTPLCEGILKVLVTKAHDSTDCLAAQSSHFGSEVQGEGESDQLRRGVCGLGKRTGDLGYVAISELLEGAVRQFLEEVLDTLVPAYLESRTLHRNGMRGFSNIYCRFINVWLCEFRSFFS